MGIGVKRAARTQALHSRHRVKRADDVIVTLAKGLDHRRDTSLIAVERRLRRDLRNRRRIGRRLRLDVFHRGDDRLRTATKADPPSGHRICLGYAIEDDGAIVQVGTYIDDVDEIVIVELDVLVHVVGGDQHLRMPAQHRAQRPQFVGRIDRTGRVTRAVDEKQLGPRGDRRLELLRRDAKALLHAGLDHHRLSVANERDVRIRDPVRCRNDHLVANVNNRLAEIENALFATN